MDNELEIDVLGFWWILDNIDKKLPGRLTFSKSEGGILELFQNDKYEELEWHKTYSTIRGNANGQAFTLYKSTKFNSENVNGLCYYKLKTDTVVSGYFFLESEADFKFSELGVKLSNVDEWLMLLKAYEIADVFEKNISMSFNIKYSNEVITFSIDDLLEGSISTCCSLHHSISHFSVNKHLWFNVNSKDSSLVKYEVLMKKINFLRIFFSFILGGKCIYQELRIVRSDLDGLYSNAKLHLKNSFGKPSNGYILIEFEEFRDRLGSIIENWFRVCKEMPEVINLFYSIYTANPIYDYHFRESYIALEGLFQWKYKKDTPENVVSPLVQPFIHISKFSEIIRDYKKWWIVAKNNRHYQVHLNKEKYLSKIVSTPELVKIMRKIEAIIVCYILKELGFSDDEINQIFTKSEKRFIASFF